MNKPKKMGTCGSLALIVAASAMLITFAGCNNLIRPTAKPVPESADTQAKLVPAKSIPMSLPDRTPRAGRTLVFPRAQFKYSLGGNYMRQWLDRPLFQDRAMRIETPGIAMPLVSLENVMRTAAASYEVDGLAFFPETVNRAPIIEASDKLAVPGFKLLPEFTTWEDLKIKRDSLERALAGKSAVRLDGKLLITSYGADRWPPEKWKNALAGLRKGLNGDFLFLVQLNGAGGNGWLYWIDEYNQKGSLSAQDLEAIKATLRSYLDVCDGIMPCTSNMIKYRNNFDARFYREIMIPIFRSVVDEPKYRKKLLGMSVGLGYFNPESGSTCDERGTKTMREAFQAALEAQPDVIVMPEWDEENENTCFRPTVCNSLATQRVIRHFMRKTKRLAPAPNPGDDTKIPNLIFSYRRVYTLGERIEFEILNVPDGTYAGNYTVCLTLKDLAGKVIKEYPPMVFAADRLMEARPALASEDFAGHMALTPSLTVKNPDGVSRVYEDGLQYIRLRATWNFDTKWIKQPLRDLLPAEKCAIAFVDQAYGPGEKTIAADFACGEKLASLEIEEDNDVVYALDKNNEYQRDDKDNFLLCVEYRAYKREKLKGVITVSNGSGQWLTVAKRDGKIDEKNRGRIEIASDIDWYIRRLFLSVPQKDAAKAMLNFDLNCFKFSVPVARVIENGIWGHTQDIGQSLFVSRYYRQPDHPCHLDAPSGSFTARVLPRTGTSIYNLRAISKSGKIYRGRPLLATPEKAGTDTVPLTVYSETAGRPVVVKVEQCRIPDIVYDFTDKYGSVLHTDAGRAFWGALGGYVDAVTDRGRPSSGNFWTTVSNVVASAPAWVKEDGKWCLLFDGKGAHVILPLETTPRRGSLTISFSVKPLADKPQTIYAHYGHYIGSLVLNINEGRLTAKYTSRDNGTFTLDSGLRIETGKWSDVVVKYDLANMVFSVNGVESKPMPCPGPGLYIAFTALGGFSKNGGPDEYAGTPGWFAGYLRDLRIVHNCVNTAK